MSALCWLAEPQTPDHRHSGLELLFADVPGSRRIATLMIEAGQTVTSKIAVCQPDSRMTLNLMTLNLMTLNLMTLNLMRQNSMRQNSNQYSRHKADWSDVAFSEWWTCRGYLYEDQAWDDGS